ncbi:MAG: 2-keto-4-pentenoate hydratase [Betaproteobacteria bacterium RIFCSPLOWO2_02_FULL_65_24]|nr:MAG: 2-keto-4-pentenoate hydratase [Betaproteobacteria bacterium RIFCSPLOWO2_02_FULL_65_24]
MSYKLLSYHAGRNDIRAGLLVNDQIYDVARVAGSASYATVMDVLNDWRNARRTLAEVAKRLEAGRSRVKGQLAAKTRLAAPVPVPGTVYCAGANYADHAANMARKQGKEPDPDPHTLGLKPWHFQKAPRSCVVGPGSAVKLPSYSKKVDWELELAVVIGLPARNVPVEKALNCVAGYTIGNDLSARDLTKRPHLAADSPFKYDWIGQKNFEGSCPMGPWITPASDIRDPQNLDMKLWVDGELMQDSNTGKMLFTVAEQIAHVSSAVTLHPGDVFLTGTCAGTGAERDIFLKTGQTIKLWIDRIGEFSHKVV